MNKDNHRRGTRQVSAAATAALVIAGMGVSIPTAKAQTADDPSCPALHVLLAPGTSETSVTSDPNADNHGYLSSVIRPVMDQANDGLSVSDPGAGFSEVIDMVTDGAGSEFMGDTGSTDTGDTPNIARTTITYPSTAGGVFAPLPTLPANFGDLTSYEQSVAAGVAQMEAVAQEIIESCDNTQIAAMGYSQGAEVTSSFARSIGSGESSIPDDRIAAIALFSDPTREGGTPALVNSEDSPAAPNDAALGAVEQTMTGLSDIDTPAASGLSPEKTGIDHFGTLSDRTVSWCLVGDYVCGLPAESEVATEIVTLLEKITLEDPVEALTLLAESMDSAVNISDFSQVADIDFGEDGFKTAGVVRNGDDESSVLAERAAAAADDFTSTDDSADGDSAESTLESDTTETATDSETSAPSAPSSSSAVDTPSAETVPEAEDDTRATDSLPGTHSTEDQDGTDAGGDFSVDMGDSPATEQTTETDTSVESSAVTETDEPTEVEQPQSWEQEPAEDTTGADPADQVDPFSSPEAFANAAIPAAARLGGMALGTGITVAKDAITPQNLAQLAVAGVSGGPQAAATVAAGQFARSGMKLLEPSMASGKAREVLTIVEDSGFEVPEIMKIAVELSAWLSVTEHIEYGNRALMPDGRSAEQATQDWLLAAAGDTSGNSAIPGDLMDQAIDFGVDALSDVAFDADMATAATTALREVTD